jgi:TRAP-type mannitol/chloroaromatic compound transport system permease small subunit
MKPDQNSPNGSSGIVTITGSDLPANSLTSAASGNIDTSIPQSLPDAGQPFKPMVISAENSEKDNSFMDSVKEDLHDYIGAAKKLIPLPHKKSSPKETSPDQQIQPHAEPHTYVPQPYTSTQFKPSSPPIRVFQSNPDIPAVNEAALEFIRKNTLRIQTDTAPYTQPNQPTKPWTPPPQARPVPTPIQGSRTTAPQVNPQLEDTEYDIFGRIISATLEERKPTIISLISNIFFLITFTYTTLTILLIGTIIALAIALTNAGSPGFVFLRYYPNVGLLPVFSCAATLIFMFVSYKIRDGSRSGWFAGVLSLVALPVSSSLIMPVLAYPLIKLVSVFAGTPEKPIISPSITVQTLGHYFSMFLVFDILLILLLITLRMFRFSSQKLSVNAKTSLIVIFLFFFIPTIGVLAYGYWEATDTDYGLTQAESLVAYKIYYPIQIPHNRVNATRFISYEELADSFNAVKVTYDVPLPVMVQTGKNSPIIVKQVNISTYFNFQQYVSRQERDAGTTVETVTVSTSAGHEGYVLQRGNFRYLWLKMPDNVLINISSPTAGINELIELADALQ